MDDHIVRRRLVYRFSVVVARQSPKLDVVVRFHQPVPGGSFAIPPTVFSSSGKVNANDGRFRRGN